MLAIVFLALEWMLKLDVPEEVLHALRRKLGSALHTASEVENALGNTASAWRYHIRSMLQPKGIQYFSSTRHLIRRRKKAQKVG